MAIRTTKQVKLGEIETYPDNINEGDVGGISQSLEIHGQYRAIVVSEATGYIVAGNHTYLAAKALGWKTILAHFLPGLTPEQEHRIALADNEYARKAVYDQIGLAEILTELASTETALEGTGFDGDDLDQLLADLDGGDWGEAFGNVTDTPAELERGQMTFQLTASQLETVKDALSSAGDEEPPPDGGNRNGHALAWICEQYLEGRR